MSLWWYMNRKINFDLEDGIVKNVSFVGGCNGNTKGISKLVDGMQAEEVIKKLEGTQCGFRGTSCPDQLCRALELLKQAPPTDQ